MTRAFVLGNGISRKGIALLQLKQLGTVYGCNALYREFTPDVLIATDRPIATAIQESGYAQTNRFYTRKPDPQLGALLLPKSYQGYSSGPNAVGLAALDGNLIIYMLGFDMGPAKNELFNNVYADTDFYKTSAHPPTFTGNWIKQLVQITKDFPKVQFIRVCGETTARIPELEIVNNLEHLDLDTFLDRINNKKDL
jgi:hypothetical protein